MLFRLLAILAAIGQARSLGIRHSALIGIKVCELSKKTKTRNDQLTSDETGICPWHDRSHHSLVLGTWSVFSSGIESCHQCQLFTHLRGSDSAPSLCLDLGLLARGHPERDLTRFSLEMLLARTFSNIHL